LTVLQITYSIEMGKTSFRLRRFGYYDVSPTVVLPTVVSPTVVLPTTVRLLCCFAYVVGDGDGLGSPAGLGYGVGWVWFG